MERRRHNFSVSPSHMIAILPDVKELDEIETPCNHKDISNSARKFQISTTNQP